MKEKVILICIDGMRPDGFLACGNPFIHKMMELGSYCLESQSVFPSSTLPCHMSMFHSVPPERHGILSNTYVPMVRPVSGLFEQIKAAGGKSTMYYGWEPLRDVSRPGSLISAEYVNAYVPMVRPVSGLFEQIKFMGGVSDMYYGWEPLRDIGQPKSLTRSAYICARGEDDTDNKLTKLALERIREDQPDFMFLYLVDTDEKGGHDHGWMSDEYLNYIDVAIENVKRVYEAVQEVTKKTGIQYTIIVTADHGGHDRIRGTTMKEDMTIPTFFIGKRFDSGKELTDVSILDLAPTIVDIMGVPKAPEWEGKSLANT